jgi:hypothetical protein
LPLLRKEKKDPANENKRDYAAFAYSIISKVLNLVPTDMRIENLTFKLDDNGKKAKIDIKKLTLLTRKWRRRLMFKLILFTALANKRFCRPQR